MSKHWLPDNVVRPDFRRRLGRGARRGRWQPIALFAGAALAGAAIGLGESVLSPGDSVAADPAIECNALQAVPTRELAADELAWERRSVDAEVAASSAATAHHAGPHLQGKARSFGFCHSGGGSNCVVDGDTIRLSGQRIRVADIDAPETHPPRCAEEARLGSRATQRLQQLLNGGAVSLQAIDRDSDKYGRKLRVVLVDGRSVGDTLVEEGLARSYGNGRRPWC